jgi:hypothetical protein
LIISWIGVTIVTINVVTNILLSKTGSHHHGQFEVLWATQNSNVVDRGEVRRALEEKDPQLGRDKLQNGRKGSMVRRQGMNPEFSASIMDNTVLLWWTLFICVVASTVFFAAGHARSPHKKGTTKDADFWFLAQSSTMQLLGIVVTALLEWRDGRISVTAWIGPATVAGICSVSAIPTYLILPTEWSSLLGAIAGGIQTFLVLQHFVS